MMLFPPEVKLVTTRDGLRLRATPIREIAMLHKKPQVLISVTAAVANEALNNAGFGPLDVRLKITLEKGDDLAIKYQGSTLATVHSADLDPGRGSVGMLIDKGVAEIFVDDGARYIEREIPTTPASRGLELGLGMNTSIVNRLEIYPMHSIW